MFSRDEKIIAKEDFQSLTYFFSQNAQKYLSSRCILEKKVKSEQGRWEPPPSPTCPLHLFPPKISFLSLLPEMSRSLSYLFKCITTRYMWLEFHQTGEECFSQSDIALMFVILSQSSAKVQVIHVLSPHDSSQIKLKNKIHGLVFWWHFLHKWS